MTTGLPIQPLSFIAYEPFAWRRPVKPSGSDGRNGLQRPPVLRQLRGELATEDGGGAGDDWSAVAFGRAEHPASVTRRPPP